VKTIIIQFNSIYLRAKLNSPEANYKVSTGKKMGRVRSKKESENNNNSIQFIYVQNLTAQRPITKLAQARKWEE
jgi:hypothetical protein